MKNFFTKAAVLLSSISAGIFLIGYNIGTGSITTMASAGSEYGMTLTWALIIIFMTILINRRRLMGSHRASIPQNVVYIAVSIFAVAMAAIGIAGIGKLF